MKAVILAAGQGSRLRPLTDRLPKCLVPMYRRPMIEYQMEYLDRAGFRECVIVVGYLGDMIRRRIGSRFGRINVKYVTNEIYDRTNNIYSLWLARSELNDDVLLLEGDLVYEYGLLQDVLRSRSLNVAVVDHFRPPMNGTVILEQDGVSTAMVLKSQQPPDFDFRRALKTVNIYALSRDSLSTAIVPELDSYVSRGLTGEYYEAVMSDLIGRGELQMAVHLTGSRMWTEIDTEDELREAEQQFAGLFRTSPAMPRAAAARATARRNAASAEARQARDR
ncbi:MAG: phosphocholine cytidylyltransferase family protein [Chloroflexota bacterium]|nr:phosphocholine cytidylyltransferase family protein [Chloroflexota bacterium]MDE2941211.1 phosphocholine cytidylyltransferase family protein [Chloroflexota bacterium]MDE3268190.1 phosphocholine cytidylyltransferase family protein [Chloroflexota bacterium]